MRRHTWGIILSQKEIPDIVRKAFPDLQQPHKWIDNTYELRCTTYDPITSAQFALLTLAQLSEHGISSLSCSSAAVRERHQQVRIGVKRKRKEQETTMRKCKHEALKIQYWTERGHSRHYTGDRISDEEGWDDDDEVLREDMQAVCKYCTMDRYFKDWRKAPAWLRERFEEVREDSDYEDPYSLEKQVGSTVG